MHRNAKRTIAAALALALAAGTLASPAPADAARKPKLSRTSLTLKAGKKAKVKIKNVTAKKVKKLTVKTSAKKTAAVKKNGKTAFTVTAKKKGNATITAGVKAGKKTTNLKLRVKVTGADKPSTTPQPPAVTAPATPAPPAASAPSGSQGTPSTDAPAPATPAPPTAEPLRDYLETFEGEDGNGSFGDWHVRCGSDAETKLELSSESHDGSFAALVTGREKAWNGLEIDLTDRILPGGKYRATFYAKVPEGTAFTRGIDLRLSGGTAFSDDEDDVTYENYPRDKNQRVKADDWKEISEEFTVSEYFYTYNLYIETFGFDTAPFLIDDFHLELIEAPAAYDPSLPSIKEAYAPYIPVMGVAVNYGQIMNDNTRAFVKHHFNSITMGNEMKIDNMLGTKETLTLEEAEKLGYVISDAYKACPDNKDEEGNVIVPKISFSQTDQVLKQAKENGLQVRVHSPFWHAQMPQHFFTKNYKDYSDLPESPNDKKERFTDQETMYTREEMYVQTLLKHIIDGGYEDTVSALDVVNEYLHMVFSPLDKYRNYWQCIFGEKNLKSPYVKKAFAAADEYLRKNGKRDKIKLMYNDFSTYDEVNEVIGLINNINAKDDQNPSGNKLCDGIGMQSHVGLDTGAEKYENAIEKFNEAGFEIQVTELDVASGTVTSETTEADKAKAWEANAKKYAEIMEVILRQKAKGANITQVTVWGVTDASSWMQDSAPLLFGATVADKKPSFDAFVNAALNFKK